MGLKDFKWQAGLGFGGNLTELWYEIKFACQRFWRGIDDPTYWDYDQTFYRQIQEVIEWHLYFRQGSPMIGEYSEKDYEESHRKWNEILRNGLNLLKKEDKSEFFDWFKENCGRLWD